MKRILFLLIVFVVTISTNIYSQANQSEGSKYSIYGTVYDAVSKQPMEYATVALMSKADSAIVEGTTTNPAGEFRLNTNQEGEYFLRIGFIGYERTYKNISLKGESREFPLGEIMLEPAVTTFDEVNITAQRHGVEYRIDKKVVHVAEQYSAISGNAADVLENVPSIQVDIEGNVSLRGNSNFTVLIDDRPTVLDANDALQQIPAGMIQDIEIITNPSAKYDPEGTAGIINIITKKERLTGLNGIAHLNAGLDDKYGADLLLNYRGEKISVHAGGDYNKRNYPGSMEEINRTFRGDTTFHLNSVGDRRRIRESYSARAGFDWYPRKNITFSLSGRYGSRSYEGISDTEFTEFYEVHSPDTSFIGDKNDYTSIETGARGGDFYSIRSEYMHTFGGDRNHKFDMHLMLYTRDGEDESVNNLRNEAWEIVNGQRSLESGPATGFRYRANYKRPFSDAVTIETGFQGRLGSSEEINRIYYYNTASEEYELQEDFSHDVEYSRSIHAVYGLVMGELDNFGYQLGLRGEYTFRLIELMTTREEFEINRWDYFPTIHTSYQLPNDNQLMASYSRRIDRPRGWYLEPFYTWSDAYNIRRGNPGLQPEYIDSWEVGYQKSFGDNSISVEAYYRKTKNRIEGIRSIYEGNIMLRTYENVGTDYALGTEIMLNLIPIKGWESGLTGNFYDYRVEGRYNEMDFERQSFTWSLRWNNIVNITKSTRLQINPAYHSPEVEAQETEEGYFVVHGAIRQEILQDKLNATLQFRDILSTGKHESEIIGNDFYNYRLYEHKAPIVMLNVTWTINNYRNEQGRRGENGGEDFGGDEM